MFARKREKERRKELLNSLPPEEMYEYLVNESLESVKYGQHLRFINYLFLTKEVCLEALRHETSHNSRPHDIGAVPIGNIDYVLEKIKQERQGNDYLIEYLEERVKERKKLEKEPGYYGDKFKNLQEILDYYQVETFDQYLKKRWIFLQKKIN